MTVAPEDFIQHQHYIRQQLEQTAKWQNAGMTAYTILLPLFISVCALLCCGSWFIPSLHEAGCKPMGLDTLLAKTFILYPLTLAAIPIGTLIGIPVARRRLRRLIAELHQAGEKPQSVMTMMTHARDKNIQRAAEEGLRLLAREGATLPASVILLRAADTPTTAQSGVLLRPAAHVTRQEPAGQLLRATASDDGNMPA